MTRRSFYLLSLGLPLTMPLLIMALFLLLPNSKAPVESMWTGIGGLLVMASFWTWPQYIVFSLLFLIWARRRSTTAITLAGWLLPVLFIPFCTAGIMLYEYLRGFGHAFDIIRWVAPFCMVFGYFYVFLSHILAFIVARCRIIKD